MKKVFLPLLFLGALALSSCEVNHSSIYWESGLKNKGYAVTTYSQSKAKETFTDLNYNGISFMNALYAEKGADENKEIFLAFFFIDVNSTVYFMERNHNENEDILGAYGRKNIGENLKGVLGYKDNVAYVGTAAAYEAALH